MGGFIGLVPNGFVDLGLPSGTLWATMNIGSEYPEDPGLCFTYGSLDGKKVEDVDGSETSPLYNADGDTEISYTENDICHHQYQTHSLDPFIKFRMPTADDYKELLANCDEEWIEERNGYQFTSRVNRKSIFLPSRQSAGYIDYWTSSSYVKGSG
jgi:hypothetical protein